MSSTHFQIMKDGNDIEFKSGIPIFSIYFLGKGTEDFKEIPMIKISIAVSDLHHKTLIKRKNNFIDSLFHEGIIINIPALSQSRRNEIELLLSIFDQDNRLENHHIMNVKEIEFPEKFRPIFRRLQKAAETKEVRDVMSVEDDFLEEINDYETRLAEAIKKQDDAIRKEQDAIRKEQDAIGKKDEAVKLLLKHKISPEEISQKLGITVEYIMNIGKD